MCSGCHWLLNQLPFFTAACCRVLRLSLAPQSVTMLHSCLLLCAQAVTGSSISYHSLPLLVVVCSGYHWLLNQSPCYTAACCRVLRLSLAPQSVTMLHSCLLSCAQAVTGSSISYHAMLMLVVVCSGCHWLLNQLPFFTAACCRVLRLSLAPQSVTMLHSCLLSCAQAVTGSSISYHSLPLLVVVCSGYHWLLNQSSCYTAACCCVLRLSLAPQSVTILYRCLLSCAQAITGSSISHHATQLLVVVCSGCHWLLNQLPFFTAACCRVLRLSLAPQSVTILYRCLLSCAQAITGSSISHHATQLLVVVCSGCHWLLNQSPCYTAACCCVLRLSLAPQSVTILYRCLLSCAQAVTGSSISHHATQLLVVVCSDCHWLLNQLPFFTAACCRVLRLSLAPQSVTMLHSCLLSCAQAVTGSSISHHATQLLVVVCSGCHWLLNQLPCFTAACCRVLRLSLAPQSVIMLHSCLLLCAQTVTGSSISYHSLPLLVVVCSGYHWLLNQSPCYTAACCRVLRLSLAHQSVTILYRCLLCAQAVTGSSISYHALPLLVVVSFVIFICQGIKCSTRQ